MTRNSRELSQFASFIDVRDANQNIGIITSIVIEPGGIGIGSTVADYRAEVAARGAVDPLINFNESYLLDKVYIEADINVDGGQTAAITSAGSTFNHLNVAGLTTTQNLTVTGISTLGGDTGIGTLYVGSLNTEIGDSAALGKSDTPYPGTNYNYLGVGGGNFSPDNEFARAAVIISQDEGGDLNRDDYIALQVFGRTQFNGRSPDDNAGLGTAFVVVPESFFHNKITSAQGIDITNLDNGSGNKSDGNLKVFNSARERNFYRDDTFSEKDPAVYTSGGILVDKFGEVGLGFSVGERLQVGFGLTRDTNIVSGFDPLVMSDVVHDIRGDISIGGDEIILGFTSTNHLYDGVNDAQVRFVNSRVASNILPLLDNNNSIGDAAGSPWPKIFAADLVDVGISNSITAGGSAARGLILAKDLIISGVTTSSRAFIPGIGLTGADATEALDFEVQVGATKVRNFSANGHNKLVGFTTIFGELNVITSSGAPFNGYAATAFHANQIDVTRQDANNSANPEYFFPAMVNSSQTQTAAGALLFVNPGFYLDAFGSSLYIQNDLNVLGTAINADPFSGETEIRFDVLNYRVDQLQLAGEASQITMGQAGATGVTTIFTRRTDISELRLFQNNIESSVGSTCITLDNLDTIFTGSVTIGGTQIAATSNQFEIASDPNSGKLFTGAADILIGPDGQTTSGVTTIRSTITEVEKLQLNANQIRSSDAEPVIEVGVGATFVQTSGDLIITGIHINTGFGETQITLDKQVGRIEFYNDIMVNSNKILSSDGNINIQMFDNQELTSFTGAIRVEGDTIQAGSGNTNITMQSNQLTRFAGAIQVDGNQIRSSDGQTNIEINSDFLTEFKGDIRVGGAGSIQAGDGVNCITLEVGTGNVAISSDLTANSAFFNGLEARLNVQDVDIRDNLLRIGMIEDPTTEGSLIPPNVSTGNTGDVGILMARYDVGLSTHKYAGIFFDDSNGRIAIRTDVEDDQTGTGRNRILQLNGLPSELEIKNLLLTLNNTIGVKTLFEPSATDDTVLVLGNVEIDGGTY
tara:strand:+ start:32431 stop:35544 length:3114 start_codon:yes stop_codon:yes gene_type:complete